MLITWSRVVAQLVRRPSALPASTALRSGMRSTAVRTALTTSSSLIVFLSLIALATSAVFVTARASFASFEISPATDTASATRRYMASSLDIRMLFCIIVGFSVSSRSSSASTFSSSSSSFSPSFAFKADSVCFSSFTSPFFSSSLLCLSCAIDCSSSSRSCSRTICSRRLNRSSSPRLSSASSSCLSASCRSSCFRFACSTDRSDSDSLLNSSLSFRIASWCCSS
mmetsp:Transcript_17559/g.47505  ORF Transcript_17559/g.47505 Transcript_17559/m.47505 type:complete len:226 (+) Transcript_17559:347-1024(+)